ncbi:MAG: alkaline phosphatase family protein [Desulfobacteraceae bacterium]|nr:alkaline phosphatase family protein [Desulfobacteraceae bacterium]
MKIIKSFWVVLFIIFFIGSVNPGPSFANQIKTVLIVSIDALHPKAIDPKTSANIQKLMEQGVYTLDGFSTNPPLTLLSHSAMFLGIGPEQGGRTNNRWQTGQPGIKEKTIFDDAKTKGFSTGFFFQYKIKLSACIEGDSY